MKSTKTAVFALVMVLALLTLTACSNQNGTSKIKIGTVTIVSDGKSYEPKEKWVFDFEGGYGPNGEGRAADGARLLPEEVVNELEAIPCGNDFEIVIDGEPYGDPYYTLYNSNLQEVYYRGNTFSAPQDEGTYILFVEATWGNENAYSGYQYCFKLEVAPLTAYVEAGNILSEYLAENHGFVIGDDYLERDGVNVSSVMGVGCYTFSWRYGQRWEGIQDRLHGNYAISVNGDKFFYYDRGIDAWFELSRPVNATTELIGNPDRVILMVDEVETVYEADSAEYKKILEILNERMPDGFGEAASAFMWLDEDEDAIDWSLMAQDFDYVRLAYDNPQTVKINCMKESYEDYAPEVSFQDITFPLTESDLAGSTELFILGMKFFGVLDNSEGTMSKLLP